MATDEEARVWSSGRVRVAALFDEDGAPVFDGLECQRIFGPTVDYQCACRRYRGERFRLEICVSCGVDVTSSEGRSRRLGHIVLPAAVPHPHYGAPFSVLPVLPPGLRPSTPRSVHRITDAYQRILGSTEAAQLEEATQTLFERLRDTMLGGVEDALAHWSDGEDLPNEASAELLHRAMLATAG